MGPRVRSPLGDALELRYHFHDLRHCAGTMLCGECLAEHEVAKANHAVTGRELGYTHPSSSLLFFVGSRRQQLLQELRYGSVDGHV